MGKIIDRFQAMEEKDRQRAMKLGQKSRLVRWLIALYSWPHEICPYLMARMVGLEANGFGFMEIFLDADGEDWKWIVVLLTPTIVGLVIPLLVLCGILFTNIDDFFFLIVVNVSCLWLAGCLIDIVDIWEILRKKKNACRLYSTALE